MSPCILVIHSRATREIDGPYNAGDCFMDYQGCHFAIDGVAHEGNLNVYLPDPLEPRFLYPYSIA